MEAFKSILSSRTIITNIITTVASLAAVWGLNLSPETQAGIVSAIVVIGPLISSGFRVAATHQLVSSPAVADAANKAVRPGIPVETALVVGKAKVAAAENNRDIA
jgi:hypothetical protein